MGEGGTPLVDDERKSTFKNVTYTLSQTFKTKLKNYHSVIIHLTNEYDNY